jgi:hypothetical protein
MTAAQTPGFGDAHDQNGVLVPVDYCGPAGITYDPCPAPPADLVAIGTQSWVAGDPFTVYAWDPCSAISQYADAADRARRQLVNGEARTVERVFWTGTPSVSGVGSPVIMPHLAEDTVVLVTGGPAATGAGVTLQPAATVVTSAATDLVEALGLLESQLAWCYGNQGVIHVPRSLGPQLAHSGLVKERGSQLVTVPNGNLVALGAGYTGSGPTGALTSGSSWIYGTGAVTLRRSEIDTPDVPTAVDRSHNSLVAIAQRTYVIAFECCLVAAQVAGGGIPQGAINSAGPAT